MVAGPRSGLETFQPFTTGILCIHDTAPSDTDIYALLACLTLSPNASLFYFAPRRPQGKSLWPHAFHRSAVAA